MQGASFSLYPIGISVLREELPANRLMTAMAVLSGVLGFGGGVGLVITGLLMRGDASYHRVFWYTTAFLVAVIGVVLAVVPRRPRSATGSVDWVGAAGLAAGLSRLLLAITQGNAWGWTDVRTLGASMLGAAALGSLAAATVAVLLSHHGPGGFPGETVYTVIFGLGALTAAMAMLLIVASRPRLRELETIDDLTNSRAMNHEWG
jgi:hypothetical protein